MSAQPQILLIDDDVNWGEALAEYLQRKGLAARVVPNALQGLAMLQEDTVALALIDFQMPEIDGLELLRRVRAHNQNLIVLCVSSEDEPTLPRRAIAAGAHAFVSKSTPPSILLSAVRAALAMVGLLNRPKHLLPVPWRKTTLLPIPFCGDERNAS